MIPTGNARREISADLNGSSERTTDDETDGEDRSEGDHDRSQRERREPRTEECGLFIEAVTFAPKTI